MSDQRPSETSAGSELQTTKKASPPPTSAAGDAYETYDVSTGTGHGEFQFTLYEIVVVTFGTSIGLAASRWLSGRVVSVLLGAALLAGWLKLAMNDWEPRWAAVAWFAILGAYLGALLLSVAQW
ncbi:MAG: hypothetical protein U0939_20015 [Pirellulales bacterium]